MNINLIFAVSQDNIIGKNNKLPWHIPDDLKRFKDLTLNDIVVMGRNTWLSLPENYRPLPNRTNVVLSSKNGLLLKNAIVFNSVNDILEHYKSFNGYDSKRNLWIIGGTKVLQEFLPYANSLYITKIHKDFNGDVYGPLIDYEGWELVENVDMVYNDLNYSNLVYTKG